MIAVSFRERRQIAALTRTSPSVLTRVLQLTQPPLGHLKLEAEAISDYYTETVSV